jgi:hypothetical protein
MQPGVIISVDKGYVLSDAQGNYSQLVALGRHTPRGRGIGLLWSVAKPLEVAQGDVIRIDSKLLSDSQPIID